MILGLLCPIFAILPNEMVGDLKIKFFKYTYISSIDISKKRPEFNANGQLVRRLKDMF